jgi:hypothetical protein
MDPASIRILEIGDHDYFKQQYPDRTTLLWTGYRPSRVLPREVYIDCRPEHLARELRAAESGAYGLVVAYAMLQTPWHPRYWLRSLGHSPLTPWAALSRVFGVWELGFRTLGVPMVMVDMLDGFTIGRTNLRAMDKARLYFKRELPVDSWQAFHGSSHPSLPTLRIRAKPSWQARVAKLRPISVGLWTVSTPQGFRRITAAEAVRAAADPDTVMPVDAEAVFAAKTTDIFFAGAVERSSTLRPAGLEQLKRLAAMGVGVDLPTERLPQDEYYRRMAQAWLTWSPEGFGWDCYRHYEATQCLSVPVINYPTIIRHRALEDGVHAIYYPPEGDGLIAAVKAAIADKERLKRIALAGRRHVMAAHTPAALCDWIISSALEPDRLRLAQAGA